MREPPAGMPLDGPLVDTFGRVATDLRVSLTDRCNLRCTYCMPAEGLDWLPGDELLSRDELTRLLDMAVTRLGITSVRFTGGEPLLYKGLEDVVAATAALRPRPEIALTTNGIGSGPARRGPGRGRARPGQRLAGHRRRRSTSPPSPAATGSPTCSTAWPPRRRAGLGPVKVNAVLDSGDRPRRRRGAAALLPAATVISCGSSSRCRWTPVTCGGATRRLSADEIFAALAAHFRLTPDPAPRGSAPAQLWLVDGGPATVGIIASVSHAFCSACDRTRLTADGQVRSCLFATEETDLRALLRSGADDDALEAAWRAAMWRKARRSRHQRPRLRAAGPTDERDRRLT